MNVSHCFKGFSKSMASKSIYSILKKNCLAWTEYFCYQLCYLWLSIPFFSETLHDHILLVALQGLQVLMAPLSRYLTRCDLECLVHFATILQKHPKQNEEGLGLLLHNSVSEMRMKSFLGDTYILCSWFIRPATHPDLIGISRFHV